MPSNLQRVNQAHKRREMFLEFHGKSRLVEIKLLYEIFINNDYQNLGFESFAMYVQAPRESGGLDISRSWASELIKTYEKYVIELGQPESLLAEVSPRKLYYLKKQANEDNIDEIISRAKTTTLRDLQMVDRNINENDCEHIRLKFLTRCRDCGVWQSYENTTEMEILRRLFAQANSSDEENNSRRRRKNRRNA